MCTTLVITELLVARFSAQQETPQQRVGLFLDEMGNLGRLDELARGQSYLQGVGVQCIQVWQNLPQFRETYGPTSPLLASVGTQVYYTPADHATAVWISDQLGVTTERLHPESRSYSFWGLFTSSTIGTSEHRRELMTPDEVRRLPDTDALVVSKGTAPILATKLGAVVPEVIDLAPRLRKVAAIAGAVLIGFGAMAWWQWPQRTPPPTLSMNTPDTPPAPADRLTYTPPRQRGALGDTTVAGNIRAVGSMVMPGFQDVPMPKPWTLHEQRDVVVLVNRAPMSEDWRPGQVRLSEGLGRPGHFASRRACEAERDQRLAGQANGAVTVRSKMGRGQGYERVHFMCTLGHGEDTET